MLEIVESDGRSWSVGGFGLVIPDGQPVPHYVLAHAAMLVSGAGPWPIRLHTAGSVFELVLGTDGGVTLDPRSPSTPTVWGWLFPPGIFTAQVEPTSTTQVAIAQVPVATAEPVDEYGPAESCQRPSWHRATEPGKYCMGCGRVRPEHSAPEGVLFLAAHNSAGVSTWASLLEGADMGRKMPDAGQVVGVARPTPAGLTAIKKLIGEYGVERFRSVLIVADAPGRMLPQAAREVKSLASGVPVVIVPWISKLRGTESPASVAAVIARPVARVRNELERAARVVPREFRGKHDNHNRRNA